jgi:seryl-tRNA synthetase
VYAGDLPHSYEFVDKTKSGAQFTWESCVHLQNVLNSEIKNKKELSLNFTIQTICERKEN